MKMRFAFTLIELIFAIIIMSIVVLSLPVMSQVIGKGAENNLVQEAILVASGDMFKIISGKFDENSKDDVMDFEKIIYSSNAEAALLDVNGSRAGNVNIIFDNNATRRPSVSGLDAGETAENNEDDIDDYRVTDGEAVRYPGSAAGYKQDYKKDINVSMAAFNGGNADNTKKITITIKDTAGTTELVKMHTYTFNTGSVSISPYRDLP